MKKSKYVNPLLFEIMYGDKSLAGIQTIVDDMHEETTVREGTMKKRKDRQMLIVLALMIGALVGWIIFDMTAIP